MKQKTKTLLLSLCFFLLLSVLMYFIGIWEEGTKHGFSQVVFIIGVTIGMTTAYLIGRIDSRENTKKHEAVSTATIDFILFDAYP